MTPDRYASLDEAIVKAIRDGFRSTYMLRKRVRVTLFDTLIMRHIDDMEERGLIVYNNGRWSAVEKV